MSYEYTDDFHCEIKVEPYEWSDGSKTVMLSAPNKGASINLEDAPAVALAVLTAGGKTVADLVAYEKESAERAEREAEDAKVRAFHDVILSNSTIPTTDWDKASDDYRTRWRDHYRTAHDHFRAERENAWRTQLTPTGPAVTVTDEEAAAIRSHLDGTDYHQAVS